jgi:hypothetical protein
MAGETIERAARATSIPAERMDRMARSGHRVFWTSWEPGDCLECTCGWRGWGAGADFVAAVSAHFDDVERSLLAGAIAGAEPLGDAEQAFLDENYPR